MHIRPYIGTLCGIGVGVLAIVIWMLTFQPHGGVELSHYLFPVSGLILERIYYPAQSIPVPLWYGGALLQWLVVGVVVDLLRRAFRRASHHDNAA
jgi:sterol desaturase/sphingolipid hydroxylase (fatty acid hydroxylase superfamily)